MPISAAASSRRRVAERIGIVRVVRVVPNPAKGRRERRRGWSNAEEGRSAAEECRPNVDWGTSNATGASCVRTSVVPERGRGRVERPPLARLAERVVGVLALAAGPAERVVRVLALAERVVRVVFILAAESAGDGKRLRLRRDARRERRRRRILLRRRILVRRLPERIVRIVAGPGCDRVRTALKTGVDFLLVVRRLPNGWSSPPPPGARQNARFPDICPPTTRGPEPPTRTPPRSPH